jgi:equilibrative nucleoside transporter 1/2/3
MENQKGSYYIPKDKCYATYILFYALGVVTLITSNFFTTATDYWMYKFRDPASFQDYNDGNKTSMQAEFTSDFSIISTVGNMASISFTTHFLMKKLSIVKRIIGALCGVIAIFILTCIFAKVNTDSWQRAFFILTLIKGFALTGFCGCFMVTVFQLAVKFPPRYMITLFSGQSICGVLAALVQIFALGVTENPTTRGLIYFLMGMFFVFLTLVGFLISTRRSRFFQHHSAKIVEAKRPKMSKEIVVSVLQKNKFYLGSLFIVLGSSIMLHPGVTTLVLSVDKGNGNKWNDVFFGPVISFLFYYLFDYIGRECGITLKKPSNEIVIFVISCCRIALVPMILLCNAQPREHLPVTFNNDYAYIIFIILFAFSNGYIVNLCITHVRRVTSDEEKPIAMFFVLILMLLSVAVCSATSRILINAL